ncbi:flagellin [Eubacteriales bacterium OttesenSCG-928-N14]|nr:flagellin [Eubacteriales bacterium OttesenSCG-928-N14]
MRIQNNLMALNTHRQYGINTASVAKNTEKLSSGYRVNRAGDDAAGLAISEKMRAQIRGLTMASKNSQDAISLVQTAEGALQESHQILQRMRELAVQSASDTNEQTIDRGALDAEFQQLISEIDETALKTKFNTMGLIDGTYSGKANATVRPDPNGTLVFSFVPAEDLEASTAEMQLQFASMKFTAEDGGAESAEIDADVHLKAGVHSIEILKGGEVYGTITYRLDEDMSASELQAAMGNGVRYDITRGVDFYVQTGANEGDNLVINIDKMDASTLGVKTASVATRENASKAITTVDDAINKVSSQRGVLGALQNRLQHKINNLDTSAENLQAAESRIRDLDMAKEMTEFTKNNILVQASTAMLAQANAAPQGVLSLLQ